MSRPKGFGLTRELEQKNRKTYDLKLAETVCTWFNEVCKQGESRYCVDFGGDFSWENTHKLLKDGKLLIAVARVICPGTKKTVQNLNSPFKLMENIGNFLEIATSIGVTETDRFQTAALYDGDNLKQTIIGMDAFARKVKTMAIPGIPPYAGPNESERNERIFTQEQLDAGKSIIGLQMGTNEGANAAGVVMGGQRHIMDIH